MIIFEIVKNGNSIARAGGECVEMIHTSVSYLKEKNRIQLVSSGLNEPDARHSEHVQWFDAVPLAPGDEIQIRVSEGDNADTPAVKKQFGSVVHSDGQVDYYCNFCGAKASAEVTVLTSNNGNTNICHDCLRRFNPDK